jgi:hypothetical protein
MFPCTGEGNETPTQVGPVEGANVSHWTNSKGPNRVGSPTTLLKTETSTVGNVTSCSYAESRKKARNSAIPYVTARRHDRLDSLLVSR